MGTFLARERSACFTALIWRTSSRTGSSLRCVRVSSSWPIVTSTRSCRARSYAGSNPRGFETSTALHWFPMQFFISLSAQRYSSKETCESTPFWITGSPEWTCTGLQTCTAASSSISASSRKNSRLCRHSTALKPSTEIAHRAPSSTPCARK